jgi:hypothetical protein
MKTPIFAIDQSFNKYLHAFTASAGNRRQQGLPCSIFPKRPEFHRMSSCSAVLIGFFPVTGRFPASDMGLGNMYRIEQHNCFVF